MFGDMQSDLHFTDDMSKQFKDNLDMIVKSQLLKKIIGRTTDTEYMVCMNILGALRYAIRWVLHFRNMCIVGGDEFVDTLCGLNIILPLKQLLYRVSLCWSFQLEFRRSLRRPRRKEDDRLQSLLPAVLAVDDHLVRLAASL